MSAKDRFSLPVPDDFSMKAHIEQSQAKIAKWWNCENESPVLDLALWRTDFEKSDLNGFWPSPEATPDLKGLAKEQLRRIHANAYGGDAIPRLMPDYGGRGTPMVLSFFLGATPAFGPSTVWHERFISDLKEFKPKLEAGNAWFERQLELFALQTEAASLGVAPCLPGLGDYLTNLSCMRGVQELLYDLVDEPKEIHRIRELMVPAFLEAYKAFERLYRPETEGTFSWMTWAPGPNYPVQCDFSAMLGPEMFAEFVMPEIEYLSQHIRYMCWHLDGPGEITHLDALLACEHIKCVQIVSGHKNDILSPFWRDSIEKVIAAGKGLHISFWENSLERAKAFCDKYPAKGLYLHVNDKLDEGNVLKAKRFFGGGMW